MSSVNINPLSWSLWLAQWKCLPLVIVDFHRIKEKSKSFHTKIKCPNISLDVIVFKAWLSLVNEDTHQVW